MSQNHPRGAYFGPERVKRSQQRLDCNFRKRTLPTGSKGRPCDPEGGPCRSLRRGLKAEARPPSGTVLLMVADFGRLSQVTHAGLAAREPTVIPLYGAQCIHKTWKY